MRQVQRVVSQRVENRDGKEMVVSIVSGINESGGEGTWEQVEPAPVTPAMPEMTPPKYTLDDLGDRLARLEEKLDTLLKG